ncbi:hypothetical protein PILCRDRAFT_93308 [Piloderma croceum F 1598]|uniref:Uncharacterized protein n=1 Tax=Piloderma croceum (strain F 1598) TaxID=765440 RepID=A0A0C3B656_PILCF|nr:hypothetical protein PILCRDRAFT_93308 [Piloderma croceum F 1598]
MASIAMPCHPPLPVPIDVWHQVTDKQTIVAGRTNFIPDPLFPTVPPFPRVDGTWGPHEICLLPQLWDAKSPYMAWCPLSVHSAMGFHKTGIMGFSMTREDFKPNPHVSYLGGLDKAIWTGFKEEAQYLSTRVKSILFHITNDPGFTDIQLPTEALSRQERILIYLTLSDICYRDCIEGVAALRRTISELQAFVLWYQDRHKVNSERPFRLRGAIVANTADYMYLFNLDIPVWMIVDLSTYRLPLQRRRIDTRPISQICEVRCWHELPMLERMENDMEYKTGAGLVLLHSKELFYYPPLVNDKTPFERAARGYAPRLDTPNQDKRARKEVNKVHAIASGSSKRSAPPRSEPSKKAKLADSKGDHSAIRTLAQKCRHLLEEASKLAPWAPPPVKYWEVSIAPTSTFFALCPVPEVSTPNHLAFLTPPPHIFTRRQDSDDDEKPKHINRCHALLFIWVCIRRFWQSRLDAAFISGTFGMHESISEYRLSTRKWKDLLHADAFRNASPKGEFDIQQFWTYGNIFAIQTFFEDTNPVPQVLGRALTPIDFQYGVLKALVVWDASLTSAKYQLEEADNILMRNAGLSPASQILRSAKRAHLFRVSYNIPSASHPSQSDSLEIRQDWRLATTLALEKSAT